MDDYQNVKSMLNQAKEHGLEVEVIVTAMNEIAGGESVERACQIALREWDI